MFQKQLLVILVIYGRLTDACKRYFQMSMTEFATIAFATPAQLPAEFTTMSLVKHQKRWASCKKVNCFEPFTIFVKALTKFRIRLRSYCSI